MVLPGDDKLILGDLSDPRRIYMFQPSTRLAHPEQPDGVLVHGICSLIDGKVHAAYVGDGDVLLLNAPFGIFSFEDLSVETVARRSWMERFRIYEHEHFVADVRIRFSSRTVLQRLVDMTRNDHDDQMDSFYFWLQGLLEKPSIWPTLATVWRDGRPPMSSRGVVPEN